ncbi:immunity 17 family protein [Prevotella sp. 10(H)]|uniref:immunity 17 family protein n=1 Tax=Prevotella sp. 10(H) TaxID=1158294 RepID=UPI0012DF75D6|nr:immunity 17 family protein [Prevotella sp. 10(H)]
MDDLGNKIQNYCSQNPIMFPLFLMAIGIFFLLACIFDWKIVFGDVNRNTYNLRKIDGIINMFGRKTARVVSGVVAVFIILLSGFIIFMMLNS